MEEAVVNYSANAEDLYNIACAAALSSEAFGRLQLAEQQAIFQRRALEILKKAIQMPNGYSNLDHLLQDVDLAGLHEQPEFLALTEKMSHASYPAILQGALPGTSRKISAASFEDLVNEA
ncbi:MAG: hypothetical protein ACKPHU_15980, partial [Planctomycetaceae bacterium]